MEEILHHLTSDGDARLGLICLLWGDPPTPPIQCWISLNEFGAAAQGGIPTPLPHGNNSAPLEVATSMRERRINIELGGEGGQHMYGHVGR